MSSEKSVLLWTKCVNVVDGSHVRYTGSVSSLLTSPDTVIIFGQALAGLGHLRVTDALYHGLPKGTKAVLLGSQDKTLAVFHTFVSIHPFTRAIFEWAQYGWREDVFTIVYRAWIRSHTKLLEEQLQTILDRHPEHPKTVLAIATHMGLAHQFAAIKDSFEKKHNVRMIVVVVVTDDAPIKIWAVGGADMIFVPSERTKQLLEKYHHTQRTLPPSSYIAAPYMVHPALGEQLSGDQWKARNSQLDPAPYARIHMAIPVSGAAVQLSFFAKYIDLLAGQSDRFVFHIVSKEMISTRTFLAAMRDKPNVTVTSSVSDREVVDLYQALYGQEVISLELTKPSEQAFKALIDPKKRGGSILLLSDPVGRQEWDNLDFLERHGLIPKHAGKKMHWRFQAEGDVPDADMLRDAHHWRGLRLPSDPVQAANFTLWCLNHGIFAAMMDFAGYPKHACLSGDGVKVFWKIIEEYLRP